MLVVAMAFLVVDVLTLPNGPKDRSAVALQLRGPHPGGSGPRPLPVAFYRNASGIEVVGTHHVAGAGEPSTGATKIGGMMIWPRDFTTDGFWAPTTLRRFHTIIGHESLTVDEFARLPLVLAARLEAMGEEDRALVLLRAGVLGDTHLIRRGVAHNAASSLVAILLGVTVGLNAVLLARWRAERTRRRRGLCPACGYNLRHQYIGGCPECGWSRAGHSPTPQRVA